jgi:hypothetical protein
MPEAMKMQRLPHAKGIAATTGDAQGTSDRAVQANQKSPIAVKLCEDVTRTEELEEKRMNVVRKL